VVAPPPLSDLFQEDLGQSPNSPPEKSPLVFEHNAEDIKAKETFRLQYLRRLSHEKVWVPKEQRPPKHQTLIIFDWDDTLMYTSFLQQPRGRTVSAATHCHLKNIEKAAFALLEKAKDLGNVVIVTNAQEGWVEECVSWHMPSLKTALKNVPIISARTEHEGECPDARQWKNRAFLELGKKLDTSIVTNLVAVGDSNFEMDAVHLLGQQFPRSLIKTVKLKERPSPEELMKELDLIVPKFQMMVQRAQNMKIRLERQHGAATN